MKQLSILKCLAGLLLAWQPRFVAASPSVNVALQASFDAGPYLLELLETAAQENSSAYFPLLDRIAEGVFEDITTEKDLYQTFLKVLDEDNHIKNEESLDTFKFALAIRSATPRIEAHYQYYNTSVKSTLGAAQDAVCPVWVHMDGKQYCSSTLERAQQPVSGDNDPRELPFDRTLGDLLATPAVLYADIASPAFAEYHKTLRGLAEDGQVAYRVRYRPPQSESSRPLFVSGYGVELTLKRTDYIVIDDRQAEERDHKRGISKNNAPSADDLEKDEEESPHDLKPLSSSEVARLGSSASRFVLDSTDPFSTLLKLSQDFPKYSSAVASDNATEEFQDEYLKNRQAGLPGGHNVMWINGQHIDSRQIDAYSLLEHLRRERQVVAEFKRIGLSSSEAVNILSHPAFAEAQSGSEVQRYDWRDQIEGGGVIIWLNDLEKDKRYAKLPTTLQALLQPTYPGQFPPVRRDIQNVIAPVDLANAEDVAFVAKYLYTFIKRMIPIRFGLVLTTSTEDSVAQAKIAHYLHQAYGLASLLQYLETSLSSGKAFAPNELAFTAAIAERELRPDQESLSFEQVLLSTSLDELLSKTEKYLKRLGLEGPTPPTLANGIVLSRSENYLQELPQQLGRDLQIIQQGIIQGVIGDADYVPDLFLAQAAQSRNEWIVPERGTEIRIADILSIAEAHDDFSNILSLPPDPKYPSSNVQLIIVADFNTKYGLELLLSALKFRQLHLEIEILPLHNPNNDEPIEGGSISSKLYELLRDGKAVDLIDVLSQIQPANLDTHVLSEEEQTYWTQCQGLIADLGFSSGSSGLLINGRVVGPFPQSVAFGEEEFELLLAYESSQRFEPLSEALKEFGVDSKIASPLSFAKLTSLVELSTSSEAPEGVFDSGSKYRVDVWSRWSSTHSAINATTNTKDASINIVATIDPTSELSQRWVPILRTLSKLAGVNVRIFLAPNGNLKELPIKRFYRHVLDSEPSFDENGALIRPGASFKGLPQDALLTLGMDVASSWLVAPKESVHDLDNIKLSSVKEGSNVDAIYELEHILIEGHSKDTTLRSHPRGAQLLLETEKGSFFADTIVMANLGYFQFKAQPGFWKIELKEGRSKEIFQLDSVGGGRHGTQPGEASNEVALLSFQGKTLFPKLSRRPGKEKEEVLETGPKSGSAMDFVSKGFGFAQGVLSSVGVKTAAKNEATEKHAEINIFSVASGHLYERMLNIMMLSVMKNTEHTVKFWFIEQFLSPSFKSLLPHLAEEFKFSYEMVTYKWPHWLRGQREKQREIWGYKILFLDVLFPLSLDKVIFVDADQIVRTDMYDLVNLDLEGAPYGFTPMCDSREEMEGFRFWKQGYWKSYLQDLKYHISALYVVDLKRFRELAAGDRLRGSYHTLSADPESLANLDQDLPNNMQTVIPIKSLPQDWLWCETWCSDEALSTAKTIDLCNNPLTKEPKLDRARRQVPEWTVYDDEIAEVAKRVAAGAVSAPETNRDDELADKSRKKGERERKDEL